MDHFQVCVKIIKGVHNGNANLRWIQYGRDQSDLSPTSCMLDNVPSPKCLRSWHDHFCRLLDKIYLSWCPWPPYKSIRHPHETEPRRNARCTSNRRIALICPGPSEDVSGENAISKLLWIVTLYVGRRAETYLLLCIYSGCNTFHSHHSASLSMSHLLNDAISTLSQITDFFQIISFNDKCFIIDCDCCTFV